MTTSERDAANMDVAIKRIKEMGVVGTGKHLVSKTLTNYYDGTFFWGGEGGFFSQMREEKDLLLNSFLRGLYHIGGSGKYYLLWANFEQMVWLTILLFNVFSGLGRKNENKNVIMLGIIGLTLFELIFEARSRYLYTYTPLYIVLAVYGFDYILERKQSNKRWEERL